VVKVAEPVGLTKEQYNEGYRQWSFSEIFIFVVVNDKGPKPLTCQNKNIAKCKAKIDSL